MAAGDIYKASEAQTTASQREALAALARGGTAEKEAYLAGLKAQSDDQSRMFADILSRSSQIGAPEGVQAELQAKLQPGMDRRAAALAGSQGSAETAMQQIAAGNSNYFDQVNAAVPIVKARSDEINEQNRIKAEQAEQERLLQLQLKELALMQSEASLANTLASGRNAAAKAQSESVVTPGKLISSLGGATAVGNMVKQDAAAQAQDFSVRRGANGPGSAPLSTAALQGQAANRLGLPASYGSALAKPDKQPTLSERTRSHRNGVIARVQQHASDKTAGLIVNIVGDATNLAQALTMLGEETDADLKKNAISRSATERWLRDYYAV